MAFDLLPRKYRTPIRLLPALRRAPERRWTEAGERRALTLFHEAARRVPAYKDFLKKHKVSHQKIRTISDFKSVPTINKQTYLRAYPLEKLCWDGKFKQRRWVISTTSGSTGEPFYFPREDAQDLQYASLAELYLVTNFDIHKKSTLYIDAFPMGAWIGGLFTYEAVKTIAERGKYHLSVITPGIDIKEIINTVRKFGNIFDQIIIGCYGPFLKDALDEGVAQGVNWKKYNLKFIFSAEGFSEEFRDYVAKIAGLKNIYRDTLNHYGTVDQGTLAYETPLAILIRRLAVKKNRKLYSSIFPVAYKLPTLCQYDPELFFFEEINGELLCSAFSGLPLVRYDLKDHGGVIGYEEMISKITDSSIDINKEMRRAKITDTAWRLPFVYVYERNDFSVSLYAFQVYPETIRRTLLEKQFHRDLTGKFTMLVKYDKRTNQYLEVNIELKPKSSESKKFEAAIQRALVKRLLAENSEYRKTYSQNPERLLPRIAFWHYEHPLHFERNGKQKWVKK